MVSRDFSGGPVSKTLGSQGRGPGFDPCLGKQIPYATTEGSLMLQVKILHATARTEDPECSTKTQSSRIKKYFLKSMVSTLHAVW